MDTCTDRLKIWTDIECYVFIDNQQVGLVKPNTLCIFPLHKGEFMVSLIASMNNKCTWESIIRIDGDIIIRYSFANDIEKHPEWIDQTSLTIERKEECWVLRETKLGIIIKKLYYDYVGNIYNGLAIVRKDSMYGLIKLDGNIVLECICNHIIRIRDFILYQHNFKYGIIDKFGQIVCPCEYDKILHLSGENLLVSNLPKCSSNDLKEYDDIYFRYENHFTKQTLHSVFFLIVKENRIAIINYSGYLVTPCVYTNIKYQSPGISRPEILILHRDDCSDDYLSLMHIHHYSKGISQSKVLIGWFEIGSKKHLGVIPGFQSNEGVIKYDNFFEIEYYDDDNDYVGISLAEKVGIIERSGKEILECKYEKIHAIDCFNHYLFAVKFNGKYAVFDARGDMLTQFIYDYVGTMIMHDCGYTGMIKVWNNKKVGVISDDGREVLPCEYDDVWIDIYSMCFYLKRNKKLGCIWQDIVVPCNYEKVDALWIYDYSDHNNSRAVDIWVFLCYIEDRIEAYNAKGKPIKWEYEECNSSLSWGLAKVKKNKKYGYINSSFEEVIPCIYDSAKDFVNGYAIVEKNWITYKIDTKGNIISSDDGLPF